MGRGTPIVGILSLRNPDIDPDLRDLPRAQWAGRDVRVFLTNGTYVTVGVLGTTRYDVVAIWTGSPCQLAGFRSSFPTVCG
jgi:hypothetical protein